MNTNEKATQQADSEKAMNRLAELLATVTARVARESNGEGDSVRKDQSHDGK